MIYTSLIKISYLSISDIEKFVSAIINLACSFC